MSLLNLVIWLLVFLWGACITGLIWDLVKARLLRPAIRWYVKQAFEYERMVFTTLVQLRKRNAIGPMRFWVEFGVACVWAAPRVILHTFRKKPKQLGMLHAKTKTRPRS
jgi:hypothetical protein